MNQNLLTIPQIARALGCSRTCVTYRIAQLRLAPATIIGNGARRLRLYTLTDQCAIAAMGQDRRRKG